MEIYLTYYGVLTELAGKASEKMRLENKANIGTLETLLTEKYPDFNRYPLIFVTNQAMCNSETPLADQQKIECMPPFAGG